MTTTNESERFEAFAKTLPEPVQRNIMDGKPSYTRQAFAAGLEVGLEEAAALCDWLNGEKRLIPAGCAALIRKTLKSDTDPARLERLEEKLKNIQKANK
jgi:hypothetical protein